MKANELMIEDLVDLSEVPNETIPCRVVFLHADELFVIQPNDKACDIVGYDMVTPLSLTAEILEKNGFILRGKTYILRWKGAEIHWRKTDGYASITAPNILKLGCWCSTLNGYFRYVHILQHALRLCGLNDLADNFKV